MARRCRAPPRAASARRAGSRARAPSLRRRALFVRGASRRRFPARPPRTRSSRHSPSRVSRRRRAARTTRGGAAPSSRSDPRSGSGPPSATRLFVRSPSRAPPSAPSAPATIAPLSRGRRRRHRRSDEGATPMASASRAVRSGGCRTARPKRAAAKKRANAILSAASDAFLLAAAAFRAAPAPVAPSSRGAPAVAPPPAAQWPASPRAWASAPWTPPWRTRRSARDP